MASANTFQGYYNVPGPISATATAVADYHAIGGATSGFTQQTTQNGTVRLILAVPNVVPGTPFELRAIGKTVSAVASNFTMALYLSAPSAEVTTTPLTTFTNDVSIATSSTQAVASVGGYIALNARLMYDDVNKQLMGVGDIGMISIPTTPVASNGPGVGTINATNPIGISSTAALAGLATTAGLRFFVVFTNSGAVTSTQLVEFSANSL